MNYTQRILFFNGEDSPPEALTTGGGRHIFAISKTVFNWLYSISLGLFFIVFLGLCSIVPIDVIIKSKTSSHLAVNTLIVLIACGLFAGLCIFIYALRIYVLRVHLQDIPKPYMPTDANDIPSKCAVYIKEQLIRCEKITARAMPHELVKHPGLYYHKDYDDVEQIDLFGEKENEKIHRKTPSKLVDPAAGFLPNNLVYENVVRIIGNEIKYNGYLVMDNREWVNVPQKMSFREVMTLMDDGNLERSDPALLEELLSTYERLRFSGQLISEDDFLKFMELLSKWKSLQNGR
ncbi:unnamed protein product [Kuraishia capsulata CBS 1993]|uniref:Defect at low temperature protein 1 n=1 Tax=Kuraishia capsulata CBS 1993 TaxID=1382522 RepID=W6MG37_9ASCO|nr:uncharacterized protein KUCA_T00000365001 [Kuraishia capsulata CBS 1993]CDK24403.1 unnamed protein product [Kuraishia capsulata CBS 1993]